MQAAVRARHNSVESWTPTIVVRIEYPHKVMEEIRAAACDGLHRLTHGGLEVGGVLFGERRDGSIQLVTWRPIFCEHALGPSFRLSQLDCSALEHSLDVAKSDPELKGIDAVGWFVSHTRSGMFLTATDKEIYDSFFPELWQVTLVLRPTVAGPARAGFFVREEDGSLRWESSYQEFMIEPTNFLLEVPHGEPAMPPQAQTSIRAETASSLAQARSDLPNLAERKQLSNRSPLSRERWFWAMTVLFALLLMGLLLNETSWSSGGQSFQFRAYNVGDSVRIEWDRNSPLIRSARLAVLDIRDGSEKKRLALSDEQLLQGNMTYTPKSEDLGLSMSVFAGKPAGIQQFARLVGLRTERTNKLGDTQQVGPADHGQIQQLKQQLSKQTMRANQLQEMVRILQNRIAVDEARDSTSATKLGR